MTRSRLPRPSPGPAALVLAVGALLLPSAAAAEGPPAQAPASPPAPGVERSVVTVFATVRRPEPLKPWSKQAPSEVTGSGVIIEGQRILTGGKTGGKPNNSRFASDNEPCGYPVDSTNPNR